MTHRFSHSLEERTKKVSRYILVSAVFFNIKKYVLLSWIIHEFKSLQHSTNIYLRLHIKHVFDCHALFVFVLLLDQFIFGPGHVDAVRRGACSFVIGREVRSRVSVVDQLGLNREWATEIQFGESMQLLSMTLLWQMFNNFFWWKHFPACPVVFFFPKPNISH